MSRMKTEKGIGVWAEKVNTTTLFMEDKGVTGRHVKATILAIKRGGNVVTALRWPEKHGYYGVEVGYDRYSPGDWDIPGLKRKAQGLNQTGLPPLKKYKTFRLRPQHWTKWEIGMKVDVSEEFKEGDQIDIAGTTKNKGFQGPIRRWGHKRGPMAHGSKHHRRYGSVGAAGIARVTPYKKMAAWMGGNKHMVKNKRILKIIDNIDEDNMPETLVIVEGSVPGYAAHWETGGSYVYFTHKKNRSDGRFKRDPVWLWYTTLGDDADPYVPLKGQAWTWKTFWGRDMRWITQEVKKYWPDGFPGYDHSKDPFYEGCDPKAALKAPEW